MLKTRSKKLTETDIVESLPLGPSQGRESETSIINALVSGDPERGHGIQDKNLSIREWAKGSSFVVSTSLHCCKHSK